MDWAGLKRLSHSDLLNQIVPELFSETTLQFTLFQSVILCAVMFDLYRTHDGGHSSCGFPIKVIMQAIEESSTVGVATARRIYHLLGVSHRNGDLRPIHKDGGPFWAACDNDSLHPLCQLFQALARTLLHQLRLIVIERDPRSLVHEIQQLLTIEYG